MKKIVIILFIGLSLSIFNSCEDCPEMNQALPDLLVKSFELASNMNSGDISAGDVIDMAIIVSNVVDIANDCGTLGANSHNYNLDLYWSDSGKSDSFELVASGVYDVSFLAAGNDFSSSGSGTPNKEGYYFFKSVEDSKENVTERIEDNNEKDAEIGDISNSKTSNIFYVKAELTYNFSGFTGDS